MPNDNSENEFGTAEPTLTRFEIIIFVVAAALLTALTSALVYVPTALE